MQEISNFIVKNTKNTLYRMCIVSLMTNSQIHYRQHCAQRKPDGI